MYLITFAANQNFLIEKRITGTFSSESQAWPLKSTTLGLYFRSRYPVSEPEKKNSYAIG